MGVAGSCRFFLDVADVENRLGRHQLKLFGGLELVCRDGGAGGSAGLEGGDDRLDQSGLLGAVTVAAAGFFLQVGKATLEAVEVGEHEFGLDRVGVADRVDAAIDMGDVAVLEAAKNVDDGVDFADVGEELVAEAFALGGAAYEAGDIDEFEAGRNDFC